MHTPKFSDAVKLPASKEEFAKGNERLLKILFGKATDGWVLGHSHSYSIGVHYMYIF